MPDLMMFSCSSGVAGALAELHCRTWCGPDGHHVEDCTLAPAIAPSQSYRKRGMNDDNSPRGRDLAAVRDVLLSRYREGEDVAEFVAQAAAEAEAQLHMGEWLTANRSGSWEASLLDELISGTVPPGTRP